MRGHLGPEEIKKMTDGRISDEERLAALEHISVCGECALLFAEEFSEEELLFPSRGFAQRVEAAVKKPYITVTPVSAAGRGLSKRGGRGPHEKDPQRELRLYSLKVGIAACAAILLMAAGSFRFDLSRIDEKDFASPEFSRLHAVTEYMRSLTDRIVNWEDKNND